MSLSIEGANRYIPIADRMMVVVLALDGMVRLRMSRAFDISSEEVGLDYFNTIGRVQSVFDFREIDGIQCPRYTRTIDTFQQILRESHTMVSGDTTYSRLINGSIVYGGCSELEVMVGGIRGITQGIYDQPIDVNWWVRSKTEVISS